MAETIFICITLLFCISIVCREWRIQNRIKDNYNKSKFDNYTYIKQNI